MGSPEKPCGGTFVGFRRSDTPKKSTLSTADDKPPSNDPRGKVSEENPSWSSSHPRLKGYHFCNGSLK